MPLPDLDKLRSQLLVSGIQNTNQPLWQVIEALIRYLKQSNSELTASIAPGGGGGSVSDQPYLTHQNALVALPQSRQLLAGSGITFDDSVFGERTVEATGAALTQVFLTGQDETATLVNSRELLAGTNITFDDTVPNERTINASGSGGVHPEWSVLTNGDAINPELIFAGGDVIMTHVP